MRPREGCGTVDAMTRTAKITAAAALLFAAASTPSPAATRTLPVRVADGSVQISGHEGLGHGPVRLAFRRDVGGDPRTIAVIRLNAGRTVADVEALPEGALQNAEDVEKIGRLVAGITVAPRAGAKLTIGAAPARYVIADATHEASRMAEFVAGEAHGDGVLLEPDARIDLRDGGITASPVLPRDGLIRIRNRGGLPHHALAIRLFARVTVQEAFQALKAGRSPRTVGTPIDLLALASGGGGADVERRLRQGRYVVASFYSGAGPNARSDIARGLIASTKVR